MLEPLLRFHYLGHSSFVLRFADGVSVLTDYGKSNAFGLESFQEGFFEIQDEGSQLLALAVGARPGWSVADCQNEILACVSAAARDHRFLSNNPPEVEWSGFLSEGYELTDSAEPEAAFGKAYDAVYGGAVPEGLGEM